jgi:hypothetical protein
MTVSTTTARVAYSGSGSTGPFVVPFRFDAGGELSVAKFDSAGTETVLSYPADYSVTGAGADAGGSLTLTAALSSGWSLVILPAVPLTQAVDYVNNDAFPAESHEGALDKLTRAAQMLSEQIARALRVPRTEGAGGLTIPRAADRAGLFLAFDADGDAIAAAPTADAVPVTAFAATLLDDATASDMRATLGVDVPLAYTPVNRAGDTMTGALTLSGDPAGAMQAATKQYVDNVAAGLDAKASVKAATTANITLSGAQTIDGVSVVAGDRVLVKAQSTASQNGIYVAAAGAWARATDADAWSELPGAYTWVEQGTTYGDTGWVCTVDAGGTLGTTSVAWAQFSSATPSQVPARSHRNLKIDTTTALQATVTADRVVMSDSGLTVARTAANLSATLNAANANVVNGRSSDVTLAQGWFYLYAISNGATDGVLLSSSATAPTLPSGYTYFARIGALYVDTGAASFKPSKQRNATARWTAAQAMTSGSTGSIVAWTAVPTGAFVPATAASINVGLQASTGANQMSAAPNNSYGGSGSTTNPPPLNLIGSGGVSVADFVLESSNIYYQSNGANGALWAYGWTDNL